MRIGISSGHTSPVHARRQDGSGATRLVLGLDPRRRMGEDSAAGVPGGEDLRKDGWGRCKDGVLIWTDTIMNPLRDTQGTLIGLRGMTRDITERKQLEARLAQTAHDNSLTGLANRATFFDRLSMAVHQECARASQRGDAM